MNNPPGQYSQPYGQQNYGYGQPLAQQCIQARAAPGAATASSRKLQSRATRQHEPATAW